MLAGLEAATGALQLCQVAADDHVTTLQVAHADAEGAALALSAIAPDGVKLFRTECLELRSEASKQLEQ
jgi:hypothetical protein